MMVTRLSLCVGLPHLGSRWCFSQSGRMNKERREGREVECGALLGYIVEEWGWKVQRIKGIFGRKTYNIPRKKPKKAKPQPAQIYEKPPQIYKKPPQIWKKPPQIYKNTPNTILKLLSFTKFGNTPPSTHTPIPLSRTNYKSPILPNLVRFQIFTKLTRFHHINEISPNYWDFNLFERKQHTGTQSYSRYTLLLIFWSKRSSAYGEDYVEAEVFVVQIYYWDFTKLWDFNLFEENNIRGLKVLPDTHYCWYFGVREVLPMARICWSRDHCCSVILMRFH